MLKLALERAYYICSLLVFAYAVFVLDRSPWYFALMVFLDLSHSAYIKPRLSPLEISAKRV